jgi:serine phosphatase RsbU (regulator of sigma subunit)
MKKLLSLFISFSLFIHLAIAQNTTSTITLDKTNDIKVIGTSVFFLEDTTSKLTLEQVMLPTYQSHFKQSVQEFPNLGNSPSTFWCRFTVNNRIKANWFLEIASPLLDSVVVYTPTHDGGYEQQAIGGLLPFYNRTIRNNNFLFPIIREEDSLGIKNYYFKVKSSVALEIPLRIATLKPLMEVYHQDDLGFGIYFGILLVMTLYNMFVFFATRDKTYLYYVCYVACTGLLYFLLKGYAFEYFWANTPLTHLYFPTLVCISCLFILIFANSFLHTRKYTPRLYKGSFIVSGILGLIIVVNLSGLYALSAGLSQLFSLVIVIYALITGIVNLLSKNKVARFYLLAWSFYIVGVIIFMLQLSVVLPKNAFTSNSIFLGSAIEVILLSFALADKINVLKKEKEKTQQELLASVQENEKLVREQNKVLEQRVTERTHQLQEANEELNQTVEELHATNEILNKINVQLADQRKEIEIKNDELGEAIQELNAMNEELSSTNDALAMANETIDNKSKEVEKAYTNIKILSDIGQQITQTLDLKAVIKMVYNNVNQLMDASGFGLGVYNAKTKEIGFDGFMEKGKELPFHYHSTEEENYLAVWCFRRQQPIFINNVEKELKQYLDKEIKVSAGEIPQSLLYIPLILEGESIGIITVQSFEKYAYTETHFELLKNLAAYCSIAVANANAYKEIDSKNANITKSIEYARTIQQAILPAPQQVCAIFSNFMAIYKPKDIVSGDFYWFTTTDKYSFLAVADCTGHGVPGGFMSMIGNAILKDAIDKQNIYNPADVLAYLHLEVRNALKKAENSTSDGMDITICRFEKMSNNILMMTFAGAKSMGLYFKQGNQGTEMVELKGDKQMIGAADTSERKPYTNQVFELQKGEKIYFFTDGYVDQPDDKRDRFGKVKFKEMVQNHYHLSLAEQETIYENTLIKYQGSQEQRDDITVIGLEV